MPQVARCAPLKKAGKKSGKASLARRNSSVPANADLEVMEPFLIEPDNDKGHTLNSTSSSKGAAPGDKTKKKPKNKLKARMEKAMSVNSDDAPLPSPLMASQEVESMHPLV